MSKGKLYTTYFSSKKSKGIKLAVVRFKPKWLDFKKEELYHTPQLSPSEELLNTFNKTRKDNLDYAWFNYVQAFRFEMNNKDYMKDMLEKVQRRLDGGADITLICYEKDHTKCHRSLLGEYFKNLGYEVEEL